MTETEQPAKEVKKTTSERTVLEIMNDIHDGKLPTYEEVYYTAAAQSMAFSLAMTEIRNLRYASKWAKEGTLFKELKKLFSNVYNGLYEGVGVHDPREFLGEMAPGEEGHKKWREHIKKELALAEQTDQVFQDAQQRHTGETDRTGRASTAPPGQDPQAKDKKKRAPKRRRRRR